jgi:subtilisin family serine protease
MKKLLLSTSALIAVAIVYIIITAQKTPEKSKFYYAFNQKIFINELPNKFVVKFKTKEKSQELKSFFKDRIGTTGKLISQDETTVLIDLKNSNTSINDLISDKLPDIDILKPAYQYQKQEMYYTNEILIEPNKGISLKEVIHQNKLDTSVIIKEGQFFSVVTIISNKNDACDIANKIQESGLVKYSHPNFIMPIEKHQVIPNDTYFNNQYYLRNTGQVFNTVENHAGTANADINASFAWNTTLGASTITVAVIDEGVTSDHPDLPNTRQVRLNGSNFVPSENANDPTPALNNNHGNSCAGIIAATQNNNEGVTGIAPNVRIMPIKIFGASGNADNNGLASAIDFAWQNGADVISNSWGYNSNNPNLVPAIVAAINRAVTQGRGNLGCVVSFSASNSANHSLGNNGDIHFPSNVQISGVLTVGASDRDDLQADYSPTSNVGSANNQIIDIVAPSHRAYSPAFGGIANEGFEVWTIDIPGTNGYNQWNDATFPLSAPAFGEILPTTGTNNLSYTGRMGGTSAACPQVAAVAALILSVNGNLTQQQVFDIITQSAERVGGYTYNGNGWSVELGNGRLNACAALSSIPNRYTITGNSSLCSSETYSIAGLPSGSTTTWVSSNSAIATITNGGVATRVSDGNVTFTATINIPNRCGAAVSSINVIVGLTVISYVSFINPSGGEGYWCSSAYGNLFLPAISDENVSYETRLLSYPSMNVLQTNIYAQPGQDPFGYVSPGFYIFQLRATNSCGTTSWYETEIQYIDCGNGGGEENFRVSVSPNPTTGDVQIEAIATDKTTTIKEIQVTDKFGNLKKKIKLGADIKKHKISIADLPADVYVIRIYDGKTWVSKKVIKN